MANSPLLYGHTSLQLDFSAQFTTLCVVSKLLSECVYSVCISIWHRASFVPGVGRASLHCEEAGRFTLANRLTLAHQHYTPGFNVFTRIARCLFMNTYFSFEALMSRNRSSWVCVWGWGVD